MKKLLASLLMLPLLANAGYSFKNEIVDVKMYDHTCSHTLIREMLKGSSVETLTWKAAEVTFKDKEKIAACWAEGEGAVLIVDEEGFGGMLSKEDLTKE